MVDEAHCVSKWYADMYLYCITHNCRSGPYHADEKARIVVEIGMAQPIIAPEEAKVRSEIRGLVTDTVAI